MSFRLRLLLISMFVVLNSHAFAKDYDYNLDLWPVKISLHTFSGANYGSALYQDIMEHVTKPNFITGFPEVHAHETLHRITFENSPFGSKRNAFYFGKGKAAFAQWPEVDLQKVVQAISLESKRIDPMNYSVYIDGKILTQEPLSIFNEWNAYLGGEKVYKEMYDTGNATGDSQDPNGNIATMMYYSTVLLMTAEKEHPGFLSQNRSFKALYALLAEESMTLLKATNGISAMNANNDGKVTLDFFLNSPDTAHFWTVLKTNYGTAWVSRVFGK